MYDNFTDFLCKICVKRTTAAPCTGSGLRSFVFSMKAAQERRLGSSPKKGFKKTTPRRGIAGSSPDWNSRLISRFRNGCLHHRKSNHQCPADQAAAAECKYAYRLRLLSKIFAPSHGRLTSRLFFFPIIAQKRRIEKVFSVSFCREAVKLL